MLFSVFMAGVSWSQVTVEQTLTIEEYVNDILLGSGVQASNITYTGSDIQIGLLSGAGDTDFPMEAGLVLSSADATNLATGMGTNVPFGEGVSGDADLLEIANDVPPLIGQNFNVSSVNDLCILEFDFIATGDTVRFNYSFGSDEYLEWVNSTFNDIFAFFLSGPGITGPYDSPAGFPDGAVNIAQVPDTDPPLPVTISSVNDQINSEYYINNPNNEGIFCDGFTTTLVAEHSVQCGGLYHIKLAIGDGSDTALESVVVLEQGSFESNAVVEVALTTDVGTFYNDGVIYEDCGLATMTFTRPVETIIEVEEMVIINYLGTAENGVDFTLIPDTVVFPAFVETVEFEIDAFLDGMLEGEETVIMEILNVAACNGGGLTTYFEFIIDDFPDPLELEGYDVSICAGDTVTLTPIISGGYGNFDFDWTPGGMDTYEVDLAPDVTTTYFLTVTDTCGIPPVDTQFEIEVQDFPELIVEIDQGDIELDCGENILLTATVSGGDGMYQNWSWYDEDGVNLWGWNSELNYNTWSGANEIWVEVEDGCGFTATDMINVTLNIPELIVDIDSEVPVLCNEQFTLDPEVSGGAEPYWFNWYVNNLWTDWSETFTYTTDADVVITVEVGDNCGQNVSVDIDIVVDSPAINITMEDEIVGPCTELFQLEPVIDGGSGGFDYEWVYSGEVIGNGATLDFQSDIDAVIQLNVSDQCSQESADQVQITIENPPLIIDLGEDIDASCIDNTELSVIIESGSGGYSYSWTIDNQEVGTGSALIWQTYETEQVFVSVTDGCGGAAVDQVQINIPDIPLEIALSQDTSICLGSTAQLSALAQGGEGGFVYFWDNINQYGQDITVTPSNTQYFLVTATDICGESISETVQVDVQNIFSDFYVTYLSETEVEFFATPEPPCPECDLIWDFGDGNSSSEMNPIHEFDGLSEYEVNLTVVNPIGCFDDSYTLINAPVLLYIPNSFTPNNDGVNDVFQVIGDQMLSYQIVIFNRWGETVFQSEDPSEAWVGNVPGGDHYVPNGTYSYVVRVKGFNSDAFEKTGTITVMR